MLANRADSISVFVAGSGTTAVLLALCGSTAIIPVLLMSSPSQGKSDREIRRCLKRYIARQLYRALAQP